MNTQIQDKIMEFGFTETAAVNVVDIEITQDVRNACEQNSCGQVGKNHMCPPNVGDLESYRQLIQKYDKGILFSKIFPLKTRADYKRMMEYGVDFRTDCQKLQVEIKKELSDFLFFLAGPCTICKECTAINKETCRFPDEAIPSLEAAGVNVVALTKKCDLTYNNGPGTTTLIGLLVHNEENQLSD